jgi:predicted metal-dependent enzyme (double-stranded beta helix superfamily)
LLGTPNEVQTTRSPQWAVIGIYAGCEQNVFYQRAEHGLKQHGTKELNAKDAVPLGAAIIHAVTNPLDQVTAAIHVYGGDFFSTPRSEWVLNRLEERPYDVADTMRAFEEANERLHKMVRRS